MACSSCLSIFVTICATASVNGELIDLSHEFDIDTVYWPGNPSFEFNILSREDTGKFWYESNNFSTAEHGGTHLDSPAHFSKGKWRVHQIPLENLIGPGVVIDISERAKADPDTQVEISDILEWETKHGQLPERAMVLMNSGWSPKWPNKTRVLGSSDPNDPSTFHFPGFNPVTTRWLVENRNYINAIGVDTPSIDYGRSSTFETHVTAFSANIVGLENIANLDKIPASGTVVYAIPIKLYDGSGSPMRIFAMTQSTSSSNGLVTAPSVLSSVLLSLVVWIIHRVCSI